MRQWFALCCVAWHVTRLWLCRLDRLQVYITFKTRSKGGARLFVRICAYAFFGAVAGARKFQRQGASGKFVGLEIYWGAAEPPGRDLATQIEFVDEAGDVAQVERMALYPDWPSARWPSDTIAVGRYRVRVGAGLPAGKYDVRVGAVDRSTGEPIGEPVTVATLEVKPVARTYEPPAPQFQVEGCFGDRLCVLGYDVGHRDDRLVLVFYWQPA
jgi:hypothetical protein